MSRERKIRIDSNLNQGQEIEAYYAYYGGQ